MKSGARRRRGMKIAILTNFQEFVPGYSLTGIVADQARMLTRYGHEVHLFVCEHFNDKKYPPPAPDYNAPGTITIRPQMPFAHLTDYQSQIDLTSEHRMTAQATGAMLLNEMQGMDIVFTHDLVFTGWNLPYAIGLVNASKKMPGLPWLHWIHSVPSGMRDWWAIQAFGPQHKIVYPNESDRLLVAEQYRGRIQDVRVIHHIKDLRTWMEFTPETCEIIDRIPGLMQADVVQVLPASADRLSAKRVRETILIFSRIKLTGKSVCLLIVNQWATGKQHKESIDQYLQLADEAGLEVGQEVVFTSGLKPEWEVGISKRMVRELFQCSNLFIFFTREESFGLVVPEAALAGGVLQVLNKSLDQQVEISGGNTLYFDFGSNRRTHNIDNEEKYLADIAHIILGRMRENESLRTKTFARQHYNMDYLYNAEYAPVMAEAMAQGAGHKAEE
jgi:glycosyltransferase involved in cell wall biosynthesis